MPHLGALGVNPQKLIDTLLLLDGDDVYEFMAKVLQVEETITVSKLVPSPNALISQVIHQLSLSTDHPMLIADIKLAFINHIHLNTIHKLFLSKTSWSI